MVTIGRSARPSWVVVVWWDVVVVVGRSISLLIIGWAAYVRTYVLACERYYCCLMAGC
jgi:hypothetical protein